MKNIPDKTDNIGERFNASEYNSVTNEEKNAILTTGQTLTESDLFQLAKAIAAYSSASTYYVDSGSTNTYQLSSVGTFQSPAKYYDGMEIRFRPQNSNTGASTVTPPELSQKPIKQRDGVTNLSPDDLKAGVLEVLVYDGARDIFTLESQHIGDTAAVGTIRPTIRTSAAEGWLLMGDQTIGSATSGATYADPKAEALFKELWNSIDDAYAPVTPSPRGVSADADWTANKKIKLCRVLGRVIGGAGEGEGLTARSLGQFLGEQDHQLSVAELAAHDHEYATPNSASTGGTGPDPRWDGSSFTQTSPTGGDQPHNNMQPTAFLNWEIKL
jgi:hypothetical protein